MPMSESEQHRLEMLRNRFVDVEYIADYYGLADFPAQAELISDIERYRVTMPHVEEVPAGLFDRYALEGFLQARGVLPLKWAAAGVGMRQELFEQILERRLELPTPLREEYVLYDSLVKSSFADDVGRVLPALRFRSFAS